MNTIYIRVRIILCLLVLTPISSCFAQGTIYVGGTISGNTTWSADTVKVVSDVHFADTLFIQPGTVVEFQGHYNLSATVLMANGALGDTIVFTVHDTLGFHNPLTSLGGWAGVCGRSVNMNFCKIQYVKNPDCACEDVFYDAAVRCSKASITNSIITNNCAIGISVGGNKNRITETVISNSKLGGIHTYYGFAIIDKCIIRNNSGDAIFFDNSGLTVERSIIELNNGGIHCSETGFRIRGNTIQNNGYGISSFSTYGDGFVDNNIIRSNVNTGLVMRDYNGVSPDPLRIFNNLIYNNGGGIALLWGNHPFLIISNTVVNNSGVGIYIELAYPDTDIIDCIIRGNGESQISTYDDDILESPFNVSYSNVEDLTANDVNGDFNDNIDQDPLFVDADNGDFHLSPYSPCINAGTPDTTGLFLPPIDLNGNSRVYDGRIDMGAYEYQFDNFHILKQPVNQTVCVGTAATLETEAIGGVIGYQWQKNGVDLSTAKQPVLHLDPVSLTDSGYYNCLIIADDKTVSSDTIKLTIEPDFELAGQTTSFSICPGEDTILYVSALGIESIGYAWFKNGIPLPDEKDSLLTIAAPRTNLRITTDALLLTYVNLKFQRILLLPLKINRLFLWPIPIVRVRMLS